MRRLGLFLGGRFREEGTLAAVASPYDGETVSEVWRGGAAEVAAALDAAHAAAPAMAALAPHERAAILTRAVAVVAARRDELVAAIVEEAGKPYRYAAVEFDRCLDTLTHARDLARYPEGELIDLGAFAAGDGRLGVVRRYPVGPIAAISPFNFPLNLVAHKLAPAVVAGCPVVLKPASQTPSPALLLAAALAEAGLPDGAVNVVPCAVRDAAALTRDERVKLLTFTGSAEVGWTLKAEAGRKKVVLELGGNAAAIVEPDADVGRAAARCAAGGYGFAGQSCIAVQRVYVHRRVHADFRDAFRAAVERDVPAGDPRDEATVCGPLITPEDADRVAAWADEAVAAGAERFAGGERVGRVLQPIALDGIVRGTKARDAEVFGPLVSLAPYDDFDEALAEVNDSPFGLQAGVFTNDVQRVLHALDRLEVGGVVHDDVPTFRVDHMPYGGVKDSGFGREGPRYAVHEMTEPRLLVLRNR